MKPLTTLLKLDDTEKISLIGSGGKTTLLFNLSKNLSENHPVLIGTTTQMRLPSPLDFEVSWVDEDLHTKNPTQNGRYLVGQLNRETGKLHPPFIGLEALSGKFPYTILEGDGSKLRPLKGWAPYEPVVPAFTTLTIGLTNCALVGKKASPENVHRLELFTRITGCKEGEPITLQHIASSITHPQGLFGKGCGKLVLFVTKCDTLEEVKLAEKLLTLLPHPFLATLWAAIAGSGKTLEAVNLRKVSYGN